MVMVEDIVSNRGERNFAQVFEQFGTIVNRNRLRPGHYYYLDVPVPNFNRNWLPNSVYEYRENPEAYITDREYYDLKPMGLMFHHDKWKRNALMLNLKVLPSSYRAKVIMTHLNLIERNLDMIGALSESDTLVPMEERERLNLPMYMITPSILEEASGVRLKYAISAYKLDKVARARLLDWDRVGELPFANYDFDGLAISPGTLDPSRVLERFENKQMI